MAIEFGIESILVTNCCRSRATDRNTQPFGYPPIHCRLVFQVCSLLKTSQALQTEELSAEKGLISGIFSFSRNLNEIC